MNRLRNVILGILVVILAMLMCGIFGLNERLGIKNFSFAGLIAFAAALFVLGIAEAVLGIKSKDGKIKKAFFIMAGAAAAGIPIFAILHNVAYALFFHGKDGDEAVFFIIAMIVCPAVFVIGTIGSVVCGFKKDTD